MATYIWPLSGSPIAPDMNTSFGPRVNRQQWDFHDGIDLGAPIGTLVLAMRSGEVFRAGAAGTHGYSSRHVVLRVDDPTDGVLYLVHLHLATIDDAIVEGAAVHQGQVIGTVGDDDASYPHLHLEFRKSKPSEKFSVHPLRYLPYIDTANFSAPIVDRFNLLERGAAVRLRFGAPDRAEGDLQRVEVDLLSGATLLETRIVDFNDKTTINEGIGDDLLFRNDIGVEGYQRSNLAADQRPDLQYGILVRNLPLSCDRLRGRAIDVRGNVFQGDDADIPNRTVTDLRVDFETCAMPPDGWTVRRVPGEATTVALAPAAAYKGWKGMLCAASPVAVGADGIACLEAALPEGRFEWLAEARFNVDPLHLTAGQSLRLIQFQTSAGDLSVAARIRGTGAGLRVGLLVRNPDGLLLSETSERHVTLDTWRLWKLLVRRVGTRETTAILTVGTAERVRVNWDTTAGEPRVVRAGIAQLSKGASATVLVDNLRVTEATAPQ